jgi:prephenate dehydratase
MRRPQALGQCSRFIAENLPNAVVVKTASTAGAAAALISSGNEHDAAICSKVCLTVFDGLAMLREGIQDADGLLTWLVLQPWKSLTSLLDNLTRFILVARSLEEPLPGPLCDESTDRALLRIAPGASSIATLLHELRLPVMQVDRRPAEAKSTPFSGVYFVKVQREKATGGQANGYKSSPSWREEVEEAVRRVVEKGEDGSVLGIW